MTVVPICDLAASNFGQYIVGLQHALAHEISRLIFVHAFKLVESHVLECCKVYRLVQVA